MSFGVTVVIISYNSSDTIKDCLVSLNNQSFRDFEAILVDNNSQDGTTGIVESLRTGLRYPFKTIYLDENRGFSGGNNLALGSASGKYIALLNPDVCADNVWLGELVRAIDSSHDVGICASKSIVFGQDVIDSAGDEFTLSLKGFKRGEGLAKDMYNEKEYVFGACAGAALYRRAMIDEIGFLDEDFFLIYEDTDLNFRAQLSGWKVVYVPSAVVYHRVRSSIGQMSDTAIYYSLRNSELARFKNVPFRLFLQCFPYYIIGTILEFIYFAVKHMKLRQYIKAKVDAIRMVPRMLSKRKVIMHGVRVNNKYLLSVMTPLWNRELFVMKLKKFLHN
jgi:GT2 family glycosyltransferase